MDNCPFCNGKLVFMDTSYDDDSSQGFYVCGDCHEEFSIEEVEEEIDE
jgi:transcription elongation factor Elf1